MMKQVEIRDPPMIEGILLGNPGIGKSWFLYYLMANLCLSKDIDPIILYQNQDGAGYLFHGDSVRSGSPSDLFQLVSSSFKDMYYLVDSSIPKFSIRERVYKTILVSSPDKTIYKEFKKSLTRSRPYFLPVWSWEEIHRCRSSCFPHLNDLGLRVESLFFKFGGVPRYVLQQALVTGIETELDMAIDSGDLKSLQASVGQLAEKEGESHKLLHFDVDPSNYHVKTVKFASSYVSERVASRLLEEHRQDVIAFISSAAPSAQGFNGILFEGIIHSMLRKGGIFKINNLEDDFSNPLDVEFKIEHNNEMVVRSERELSSIPLNTYCRPLSKSFAAIDSLFRPTNEDVYLFQSTVSRDHPIKRKRLQGIIDQIQSPSTSSPLSSVPSKFRLCFVVPMTLFHTYQRQKYLDVDGTVAENQYVPLVHQYVIGIDFSTASPAIHQSSIAPESTSSSASSSSDTLTPLSKRARHQ